VDFAYSQLKRSLEKRAQTPGNLDVCVGCVYNDNGKCTYKPEGLGMQAQLPAGCPKRPDARQLYAFLREIGVIKVAKGDVCDDCIHFIDENTVGLDEGWCDKYNAPVESGSKACESGFSPIAKTAQVFAPGPGPWERRMDDGMDNQEVAISTPGRSGAGPFVTGCPNPVRSGILRSLQATAQGAPMPSNAQTNSPADMQGNQSGMEASEINCPNCGSKIPKTSVTCPQCGFNLAPPQITTRTAQQSWRHKLAQYPLCYFCGEPIAGNEAFCLVLSSDGEENIGVAHLNCAQQAEKNMQGEFDESFDFISNETKNEEVIEEFDEGEEVALLQDFEGLQAGELGRLLLPEEAEALNLPPRLNPDEVYVIFDNDPQTPKLVDKDLLSKTSAIKISNYYMECPRGHVPRVLVVKEHCVLASDDPDDVFACHDKNCPYHQPVSLEGWRGLLQQDVAGSFGNMAPFWWQNAAPTKPSGTWDRIKQFLTGN